MLTGSITTMRALICVSMMLAALPREFGSGLSLAALVMVLATRNESPERSFSFWWTSRFCRLGTT